jgi:hypothetical protein
MILLRKNHHFLCLVAALFLSVDGFLLPKTKQQPSKSLSLASSTQSTPGSSFDPQYFTPPGEQARNDNSASRITLTRFLSNAVKDNPEVRMLILFMLECILFLETFFIYLNIYLSLS